jgi:hypothetical protein
MGTSAWAPALSPTSATSRATRPAATGPGATKPSSPSCATARIWARSTSAAPVPSPASAAGRRGPVRSGPADHGRSRRRPQQAPHNSSDYLLAGLIICDRCGKRYLGNIAHGRSQRFRYYTCFSRHRFGPATCPAERLLADKLEAAVLDALLATYNRTDLLSLAVAALRRRPRRQPPGRAGHRPRRPAPHPRRHRPLPARLRGAHPAGRRLRRSRPRTARPSEQASDARGGTEASVGRRARRPT